MENIIDLEQVHKKILSPKSFLKLVRKHDGTVKESEFVPPSLGKKGFGHFVVTLKDSDYSIADGKKKNGSR